MLMSLHDQITQALLPTLLAATQAARPVQLTDVKNPELEERAQKLVDYLKIYGQQSSTHVANAIQEAFRIMFPDSVTLQKKGSKKVYNPFVILENPADKELYMVTHSNDEKYAYVLLDYGTDNYDVRKFRVATDAQVEHYLKNLSVEKMKYIMRDDIFAPMITPIFEMEVEEETAAGEVPSTEELEAALVEDTVPL